ncbi:MAG: preprotein translocase subunit SecG [Alphaproteobacteria bacterium]|nr:preprotein translocase subunit SecG [Alphaproteobacteria bacterium]
MSLIVLVIHLVISVALIGVVLLQRSEGGALGMGGGGGSGAGLGGLLSTRGAGNALTRTTAFLAAGFFATSITLTLLAEFERKPASILDGPVAPSEAPAAPVLPSEPLVPFSGTNSGTSPAVPAAPTESVPPEAPPATAPVAPEPPTVPPSSTEP